MEFIEWIKYIVLGIIQGLAEPIPISSSGHLAIAQQVLGMDIEGMTFGVWLNLASLISISFILRKDIYRWICHFFLFIKTREEQYKVEFRLSCYLVLATIPVGIAGLLFEDAISSVFTNIKFVGCGMLLIALGLFLVREPGGTKTEKDITLKDAMMIGSAQIFALFPGISRSGSTIITAATRGLKREVAYKFSFFLYIPVSLGTSLLSIGDIAKDPQLSSLWGVYLLSFVVCMAVTYVAFKFFLNYMKKGNLVIFSAYLTVIGLITVFFL